MGILKKQLLVLFLAFSCLMINSMKQGVVKLYYAMPFSKIFNLDFL